MVVTGSDIIEHFLFVVLVNAMSNGCMLLILSRLINWRVSSVKKLSVQHVMCIYQLNFYGLRCALESKHIPIVLCVYLGKDKSHVLLFLLVFKPFSYVSGN